jgi:hypothetical protein
MTINRLATNGAKVPLALAEANGNAVSAEPGRGPIDRERLICEVQALARELEAIEAARHDGTADPSELIERCVAVWSKWKAIAALANQ